MSLALFAAASADCFAFSALFCCFSNSFCAFFSAFFDGPEMASLGVVLSAPFLEIVTFSVAFVISSMAMGRGTRLLKFEPRRADGFRKCNHKILTEKTMEILKLQTNLKKLNWQHDRPKIS